MNSHLSRNPAKTGAQTSINEQTRELIIHWGGIYPVRDWRILTTTCATTPFCGAFIGPDSALLANQRQE